jgi:hypothetical protein
VDSNSPSRDAPVRRAAAARGSIVGMPDDFLITCPFCGEQVQIYIEADVTGAFIQDCEVCCNPWRVHVSGRDDDRAVRVARADGSE